MVSFNKKKVVGVLGGNGLLGSDLVKFLGKEYKTLGITRENYFASRDLKFDILINANGNSKRFWANEHPKEDFELSTASVMKSLFDFEYKKYIYISSPDIYEDPSSPEKTREDFPGGTEALSAYGFHKRLSEELIKHYTTDYLILRPASILGTGLKKGIVYDVLKGNELFVAPDSKFQLITTDALADIIGCLLEKGVTKEIFNIAGVGTVTPKEVGVLLGKPVLVRTDAKKQMYEMNTEKLREIYSKLKTSVEYLKTFIKA